MGQVTCSKIDIKKFFVREQVLYDATSAEAQSMRDKSGKLVGSFSWPFTFKLEGKFTVEPAMSEKLRLLKEEAFPPNFRDKAGHASLDYKISVEVKRSGLLNVDEMYEFFLTCSAYTDPPIQCHYHDRLFTIYSARRTVYHAWTCIPREFPSPWTRL